MRLQKKAMKSSLRAVSPLFTLAVSVFLHGVLVAVLTCRESTLQHRVYKTELLIEVSRNVTKSISNASKAVVAGGRRHAPDLRIDYFSKLGLGIKKPAATDSDRNGDFGITNPTAKDLLFTSPRVHKAFDLLAEKINLATNYPDEFIENGIQGYAVLDLYFDSQGKVDEARSTFEGTNKYIRGLFVKASRHGLMSWYRSDVFQLKKDEFRNQHFRAEFSLTYYQTDESSMQKNMPGDYTFTRKRYMHQCADPSGLNLVCVGIKAKGLIQRNMSADYRTRFQTLLDRLEYFDGIGLKNLGV